MTESKDHMLDSVPTKVFLFFATVSQLIQRALYFSIGEDISTQLYATTNFVKGKGISVNEVFANDLGDSVSRLLTNWPIGYTLFLGPIYKMTDDILLSAMILDLLFIALFIFLFYQLLKQVQVSEKAIKLALLFLAISSTPLLYTTRTGVLAICFLMIAILHFLKLNESESTKWSSVILNGMLFSVPILFRYSYTPFVAMPILFFGMRWLLTKEVKFIKHAFVSLIVIGLTVLGISCIQYAMVGERTYLASSTGFGFHFSNLIYFKEFLFKGLFFVQPIIELAGDKDFVIKLGFKIFGILFSTIMLIKLLITAFKTRFEKNGNFELLAIIIITLNIALLVFLSLKYSNYHLTTYPWTFVQETRYFLPSIILLLVFMFRNYSTSWIQIFLKVAVGFAGILFIAGILRIAIAGPTNNFYSKRYKDLNIIKKQLSELNEPVVFSTQAKEIVLRNLIAIEGYPIFTESVVENLKGNRFNSSSPITLVTKFNKEDYLENEKFLMSNDCQKIFENEHFILVKTKIPFG